MRRKDTPRYGAYLERHLMKRKIKAVFKKYLYTQITFNFPGVQEQLEKAEQELLTYASGRVGRFKKRAGGL